MSRKKKPYDRQVFRAITLIMQFGINMLVPICLMSAAGIWLDKHFGTDFWMILFLYGSCGRRAECIPDGQDNL